MEKKILIVDDEKPIVDVLKFNLEKDGYKTIEAYDGEQAVEMALTSKPDLIILDVMLPKMDGFTVCKKIMGVVWHDQSSAQRNSEEKRSYRGGFGSYHEVHSGGGKAESFLGIRRDASGCGRGHLAV